MGLDQYAYVSTQASQKSEHWDHSGEEDEDQYPEPRELAYWRKHPNLQGWMEHLWRSQGGNNGSANFNGVELELVWEDLERLELDIIAGTLPGTTGFFFGQDSDEHYRKQDLSFVRNAKAELFFGLRVFYNSSW